MRRVSRATASPLAFACIDGTIARAPEGGGGTIEQTTEVTLRFNRNTGGNNQALGRSRGSFGSKVVRVYDAAGRLVDFVLVPGQTHELAPSLLLLKRLPKAPAWVLADMACDAKAFRSAAREAGATPVVPSRKGTKRPAPCPGFIYRHRDLIVRYWARIKERRAVATRYDKTAVSHAARVAIAATLDWFKSWQP